MRDLPPAADENLLWRISFPYMYDHCSSSGIYIITAPEEMMQNIVSAAVTDPVQIAMNRLDMAMGYLWPYVSHLFLVDFFPHRLAAATDILRAVDFGQSDEIKEVHVMALIGELVDALNNAEAVLAGSGEAVAAASLDKEEE